MILRFSILSVVVVLASACVKTEKIIETRQASPEVNESFKTSNDKTLSIQTAALGKVFMLIANSKTTGATPKWIEHPIKMITFEKVGSQIGIFEVGYPQIYNSLESQKILQTFDIVSESPTQISINIQSGLNFIGEIQGFELMKVDQNASQLKGEGYEGGVKLKEALITKAELLDNKLQLSQKSRFQAMMVQERKSRVKRVDTKNMVPIEVEASYDSRIEIIPYIENANFNPKEQDKDWTIGSFLTRILKNESSESQALALRWDTKDASPIRYIITSGTPKEVIPYIKEGLEYWNRVAGRTILTVEVSTSVDLEPMDRAVIVRWIPWKDVNFAYAGMQHNPMTGQIYRGQIYLSSSWLESDGLKQEIQPPSAMGHGACELGESLAKEIQSLTSAVNKNVHQATMDYLRLVVAHEAGHTLGMRHHFAAASQIKTPFAEILAAQNAYKKDPTQKLKYPELSLSVMDYLRPVDSAIVGNTLPEATLAYDKDFIDWSYNDKSAPTSLKSGLCTDDHMIYAREEGVSVYGCGRFKGAGMPLISAFKMQGTTDVAAFKTDINSLLRELINADGTVKPIERPQYFHSSAKYGLQSHSWALDNYIFTLKNSATSVEENALMTQQTLTSYILGGYAPTPSTDYAVQESLKKEISEILKTPIQRSYLLPVDNEGNIDVLWAKQAMAELNFKAYQKGVTAEGIAYEMTDEQFAKFTTLTEDILREPVKEKLNQSLMRLLKDKEAILSLATSSQVISDAKAASVDYRSWFGESEIKGLIQKYVQQLLMADLGSKNVAEYKNKKCITKMYTTDATSFEKLKKNLTESGLALAIPLAPVVEMRTLELANALAEFEMVLDPKTTPDEQLKVLLEAQAAGKIDSTIFTWAMAEITLHKTMLATGSL